MVDFYRTAHLVIFDAMYSVADMVTIKGDWGQSRKIMGVDLCLRARAMHLCMFHHEPVYSDEALHTGLQETIRYEEIMREGSALTVFTAYDGSVLRVWGHPVV